MREISRLAEELLASQEGLVTTELVIFDLHSEFRFLRKSWEDVTQTCTRCTLVESRDFGTSEFDKPNSVDTVY
jgi:hypothetical protein